MNRFLKFKLIYVETYKDLSWMKNNEEVIKYFNECDNYVKTNNLKVNYKDFKI